MFGEARLFVVVAVLPGPSPLQSPVDLVGVGVPPFAHPVLEPLVKALRLIFPGRGGAYRKDG